MSEPTGLWKLGMTMTALTSFCSMAVRSSSRQMPSRVDVGTSDRGSFTLDASLAKSGVPPDGAVYADLPQKTDPQASVMVGWRNESKTFGFLVQGFDEKRHPRSAT